MSAICIHFTDTTSQKFYRIDTKAPTPDEKSQARAELPGAIEARDELNRQCEARYEAILKADDEYQRLKVESKAAKDRVHNLHGITSRWKFTVGTVTSLFFVVKAEGDSWEEVIEKLKPKPPEPPKPPAPIPPEDRKVASAMLKALNEGMKEFL